MSRFPFVICGIIRSGDQADAKMYLSELLAEDMPQDNTMLPMPLNMRPVESFEISVSDELD